MNSSAAKAGDIWKEERVRVFFSAFYIYLSIYLLVFSTGLMRETNELIRHLASRSSSAERPVNQRFIRQRRSTRP